MPESFPPPPARVVRVWLASLDRPPLPLERLGAALVPDEARRMELFLLERDRARYRAGRGLLRHVLGDALGVAPERVPLAGGVNGRPVLAGPATTPAVAFNVSHSADRLAIAIALVPDGARADDVPGSALPLGVDVEVARTVLRMDDVARRVFDEAELALLARRADAARRATFHRLWTRKEACMKATGAGLSLPPHTFHVDADAPVQQVRLPAHPCAPAGLTVAVHDLPVGEGAAGAVAVAGDGWTIDARPVD